MLINIENTETKQKYEFDIAPEFVKKITDSIVEAIQCSIKKELTISLESDGTIRGRREMRLNKLIE